MVQDLNRSAAENVVNSLLGPVSEPANAPFMAPQQKTLVRLSRLLTRQGRRPLAAVQPTIGAIKIPEEEIEKEKPWYQHITQPVMEALGKYQTGFIEPLASMLWSTGTQVLPGLQAGEVEARRVLAKEGLMMPWTEKGKKLAQVYRETTLPKGMKGFLELAGDPLMYIGLVGGGVGLLAKAGTAGALAAKALRPAVMAERVIQRALALPIELPLKGIGKAAGKLATLSPTIAGEYAGRAAYNSFRTISGKAFVKGTAQDTKWTLNRVMQLAEHELDAHEILTRQAIETVAHANPERAVMFVENLSRQSPKQAAETLARRVSSTTQAEAVKRTYQGFEKRAIMGSMQKTLYEAHSAVWGKALRPVNLFFARAILMFGMFTPMNVLEWSGRMAERGVLPWGHTGVDTFRAIYAGADVPIKSLFEEAGTGGIVAAGLGRVGKGSNWLGRVIRGVDQGFFGWGRQLQSGMERYFFEQTDKKFLIDGMRKAGIAEDTILKEARQALAEEILKPTYRGVKKRISADLEFAVLTGNPETVLAVAEAYQIPRVRMKFINGIIGKHPEVSPVALEYLGRASKEMLATDAPAVFARMREIERSIAEYAPDIVTARMDEFIARLPARALRTQADMEVAIRKVFAGAPKVGAESDLMTRAFQDMKEAGGFKAATAQKTWDRVRQQQLDHTETWLAQSERGLESLNKASLKQGGIGIPKRARELYKQKALLQAEYKEKAIERTTEFWEHARAEGWDVEEISFNILHNLQPSQSSMALEYATREADLIRQIEKSWIETISPQRRAYKATLARYKEQIAQAESKAEAIKTSMTERLNRVKAQLDEAHKALSEEKAIAEQLATERATLGDLPPDDVLEAALRTLSPEARGDFADTLRTGLDDIGRLAESDTAELAGIREFMQTDPLATFRVKLTRSVRMTDGTMKTRPYKVSLFSVLDRYGGQFPESLTKREAQVFMLGREILPSTLNKQGKVLPEYILDEIAHQLGYESTDAFKEALEFAWRQNRKLGELQAVGSYYIERQNEINRLLGGIERSEKPPEVIIPAEVGRPEAGLQAKMIPEEEAALERFAPAGKGKVTQAQLDDWQKLQDWGMPEVGKFKSEPVKAAERVIVETKAERQAYEEVLDTLEKQLEPKLGEIDAMEREFIIVAAEPLLSKTGQAELKATTENLANILRKLPKDKASQYKAIRQESIDKTVEAYKKIFIPPEARNSVDYFMQQFFPYWMYESRRWSYLPLLFARRPVLAEYFFPGAGRMWREERGYVDIPGTDWQVNPFRGTILGTLARTAMKDYPPEHIGWRGEIEERLEDFGRAGFYFGPIYTMPLQLAMGEFGEALPAPISTPIALAAGVGMPGAVELQETLTRSRFKEYYANQILARKGIVPEQATAEQKAEALREANLASVLMEQSAMTRYRPEARREYFEAKAKKYQEFTGLTPDEQDKLRQQGLSVDQVYSLSPMQKEQLRQIEGAELWSDISLPLLPREQQKIVVARNEYYLTLDSLRDIAHL